MFVHESVDNAVVNKLSRALSFNQMKCERSSSILTVCLADMEYIGLPHPLVFQRRRLLPSLYMCSVPRVDCTQLPAPSPPFFDNSVQSSLHQLVPERGEE